jgi:Fic family protein
MPTKDIYAMTPFFPEKGGAELHGLILELKSVAGSISSAMHPVTGAAVASIVVNMNSYYSNLIEGHFTHPLDIEKALKKDYTADEKRHILQLESEAHVRANEAMRERLAREPDINICAADFICWLHGEFYKHLPEALRTVRTESGEQWAALPGQLRTRNVEVGAHIAPASNALPGFMEQFAAHYSPAKVHDPVRRILAIAATHHRLAWIHPFLDGNGRVLRLFSEAYFIKEGLAANGLWSISRGLAVYKKEYYARLSNADMKRANDYDGRGNLSDTGLVEFCTFFLRTAIGQMKFMDSLFDIDSMLGRINHFCDLMAQRGEMRAESKYLLREVFLRGAVPKSEIIHITGRSDTVARPIMNNLLGKGLLKTGDSQKAPLTMNFPVMYAPYLFPKLYPPDIEVSLL